MRVCVFSMPSVHNIASATYVRTYACTYYMYVRMIQVELLDPCVDVLCDSDVELMELDPPMGE